MELNASEPLMKCRKRRDDVKTEGVSLPWDRFGSDLLTDRMASGMKVARTWSGLLDEAAARQFVEDLPAR